MKWTGVIRWGEPYEKVWKQEKGWIRSKLLAKIKLKNWNYTDTMSLWGSSMRYEKFKVKYDFKGREIKEPVEEWEIYIYYSNLFSEWLVYNYNYSILF